MNPQLPAFILLGGVTLLAAVWDVKTGLIPNRLTYAAVVAGFVFWTFCGWMGWWEGMTGGGAAGVTGGEVWGWSGAWQGLQAASVGFFAGLLPFALIFALGGLGGGDVKLMAAIGAISASWKVVLGTAVYAFVVALVIAVALMIRHGIIRRTLGRIFGAVIFASAGLKPELPGDSPRIPFGLAACLGALLAGAEHMLRIDLPWSAWVR